MVAAHGADIGIELVPFKQMVYVQDRGRYMPVDEVPEGGTILDISGTELRRSVSAEKEVPGAFRSPYLQMPCMRQCI